MAFTIIATADIHLGRNSSRLPDNKKNAIGSTTSVLRRITEAAHSEKADAVVIAGDIIDAHNHFLEVYESLSDFFGTLLHNGIHVIVTAGNHDYNTLPEFVNHWNEPETAARLHLLGRNATWEAITLNSKHHSLQILGWSFPKASCPTDPLVDLNPEIISTDIPSLGLVHGDVFSGKSPYAPLNLQRMKDFNIQAWLLGHIHLPEILSPDQPFIAYPGSPQPLSPKESGTHTLLKLDIDSRFAVSCQKIAPSDLQYRNLSITLTKDIEPEAVRTHCYNALKEIEHSTFQVISLELTGRYPDLALIEEVAGELEDWTLSSLLYVQSVQNNTEFSIENLESLAVQKDPVGIIAGALLDVKNNRKNSFVDELLTGVRKKQQQLDSYETYRILNSISLEEGNELLTEPEGKIEILVRRTLWRLLYELLRQKQEVVHG